MECSFLQIAKFSEVGEACDDVIFVEAGSFCGGEAATLANSAMDVLDNFNVYPCEDVLPVRTLNVLLERQKKYSFLIF